MKFSLEGGSDSNMSRRQRRVFSDINNRFNETESDASTPIFKEPSAITEGII